MEIKKKNFKDDNFNEIKIRKLANKEVTLKNVQDYLSSNKDGIRWLDSEKDKHLNKGLETWKNNNIQKIIDEEINKLYPKLDPKDIKINKLEAEVEKLKKQNELHRLTNKAFKVAVEKHLPINIIEFFIGKDEQETYKNLNILEDAIRSMNTL